MQTPILSKWSWLLCSLRQSCVLLLKFKWHTDKLVPSTQAPSCFAFLCKLFCPCFMHVKEFSLHCLWQTSKWKGIELNLMWKFFPHHITANRTGTHSWFLFGLVVTHEGAKKAHCCCNKKPFFTLGLGRPFVFFSYFRVANIRPLSAVFRGKTLWMNLQLFTVWSWQLIFSWS